MNLQLLKGQANLSVQQLFEIAHPFGRATRAIYFSEVSYMEAKPQLIPPYFNIAYCFDNYSWLGILLSYIVVCLSICIIYWQKEQTTGKVSDATKIKWFFYNYHYMVSCFVILFQIA